MFDNLNKILQHSPAKETPDILEDINKQPETTKT